MDYKVDIDNSDVIRKIYILKGDLRIAETLYPFNQEEEARYIVRVCNAHEEMVEALKDSTAWVAKLIADRPEIDPTGVKDRAKRHLEKLQDLIAKLED